MRIIKWILGIALTGLLLWYFFIKPEQYQISFTTPQPPGVVHQHLLDWPIYGKKDSLQIELINQTRYAHVEQQVRVNDSLFEYNWDFNRINDSLTRVTAHIKDLEHPWSQKIQIPFSNNAFVKRSIKMVKEVGTQLLKKGENFKVAKISDTVLPSTFCAYIKVTSPINEKAKNMLSSISTVMGYLKGNEIPLTGDPFLSVTEWDKEQHQIDFDFCFPILKSDSLPSHPEILFKETKEQAMLKAVYHGNYRVSDNAWYYLIDFAERNHIELSGNPTEVYLNDPHAGGNSLEWEAHILVPLNKKE